MVLRQKSNFDVEQEIKTLEERRTPGQGAGVKGLLPVSN